jgi:hypothetical protein
LAQYARRGAIDLALHGVLIIAGCYWRRVTVNEESSGDAAARGDGPAGRAPGPSVRPTP